MRGQHKVGAVIGAGVLTAAVVLGYRVIDPGGTVVNPGGTVVDLCALPNYPSAECTGVPSGVTLTPHSGIMEIRTDGTVVDGLDVDGCIVIMANNVTVRNTRVTCDSFGGIGTYANTSGTVIQDVEVSCRDNPGSSGLGGLLNATVTRANIHNCDNGFDVGHDVLIEDSYIHNLTDERVNTEAHTDGAQVWDPNNVTFRHNRIDVTFGTSALNINNNPNYPGTVENVLIEDNLLASAGAYTLYCPRVAKVNFEVMNNRFSTLYATPNGLFGFHTDCEGVTASGNTVYETGDPVDVAGS